MSLVFLEPQGNTPLTIASDVDTLAHEIGHTHGRLHVDCGGTSALDPSFPYQDGDLGVQGFSVTKNELRNRGEYKELMGFCFPRWVSDWQYRAFTEAIRESSSR